MFRKQAEQRPATGTVTLGTVGALDCLGTGKCVFTFTLPEWIHPVPRPVRRRFSATVSGPCGGSGRGESAAGVLTRTDPRPDGCAPLPAPSVGMTGAHAKEVRCPDSSVLYQAAALCLMFPDDDFRARLPLLREAAPQLREFADHAAVTHRVNWPRTTSRSSRRSRTTACI
ncbi:hypothetical protein GCM10011428_84650 [Streptomyces violaceus]